MVGLTPQKLGVSDSSLQTFDVYNHLALDPYNPLHAMSPDLLKSRLRTVCLILHPDKLQGQGWSMPPGIQIQKLLEFKQYVWAADHNQLILAVSDIKLRAKLGWVSTWDIYNTEGKWAPVYGYQVRFPEATGDFGGFTTPRRSRPYAQPGSGERFHAGDPGASSARPSSYSYSGGERFNARARSASPRRSPSPSQQYRNRHDNYRAHGSAHNGSSAADGIPVDDDEDDVDTAPPANGPVPIPDDDDDCVLIDPVPLVQTGRYISEMSMPIPSSPAKFRYLFSLPQLIQMGMSMGWPRGRGEAIRVVVGVVRRSGEDRQQTFPEYVVTAGVKDPKARIVQIRVNRFALNGTQLPQYGLARHVSTITRPSVRERGYLFPPFDNANDECLLTILQKIAVQFNAHDADVKRREQAAKDNVKHAREKAAKEKAAKAAQEKAAREKAAKAAKEKAAREKAAKAAKDKAAKDKAAKEKRSRQQSHGDPSSLYADYFDSLGDEQMEDVDDDGTDTWTGFSDEV